MKAPLLIAFLLISCASKDRIQGGEALCRAKLAEFASGDFKMVREVQVPPAKGGPAATYDFEGEGRTYLCAVDEKGLWELGSGTTVLYQR